MKIKRYLFAAAICLLLTGCGSRAEEKPDPDSQAETVTTAAETDTTADAPDVTADTTAVTTVTETTTVTTTTEPPKSYQWVKEPFLEADDINVVAAENGTCNYGAFLDADYALIMRGDLIGMVDYNGNVVMDPKYKAVRGMLDTKEAHYEFMSDPSPAGSSQVFCVKSSKFVSCEEPQCPECGAYFLTCYSATDYAYEAQQGFLGTYTCDALHTAAVGDEMWLHGQIGFTMIDPLPAAVVARSVSIPQGYMLDTTLKGTVAGGFGLVRNNEVILPFEYEAALSYQSGVAALCKDGRWGYVNADGTVILPFEYDADLLYSYNPNRYIPNFGDDGKDIFVPYLPSGGYLALNQGDRAGYCDANGQEKIPLGEFASARPVHDGRAWVQDPETKLWGIIEPK